MSCAAVARGGAAERGQLELQRGDLSPQHGRALRVRLRLLGVAPRGARRLALDAAQLAVRLGQLPPRLLELRALGCRGELRLESSQRRLQPKGAGESGCAKGCWWAGKEGWGWHGATCAVRACGGRAWALRVGLACGPCVWALRVGLACGPIVAGLSCSGRK